MGWAFRKHWTNERLYTVSMGIYEVKRNIGLILKFILKLQGGLCGLGYLVHGAV
jgi:hypothetical protein